MVLRKCNNFFLILTCKRKNFMTELTPNITVTNMPKKKPDRVNDNLCSYGFWNRRLLRSYSFIHPFMHYAKYSTFLSMYLCQDCLSIEDYKGPCQELASSSILTKAYVNGWPQFLINIDTNQSKVTKIQIVILSFFIWSNRAVERTIYVSSSDILKEWLK